MGIKWHLVKYILFVMIRTSKLFLWLSAVGHAWWTSGECMLPYFGEGASSLIVVLLFVIFLKTMYSNWDRNRLIGDKSASISFSWADLFMGGPLKYFLLNLGLKFLSWLSHALATCSVHSKVCTLAWAVKIRTLIISLVVVYWLHSEILCT